MLRHIPARSPALAFAYCSIFLGGEMADQVSYTPSPLPAGLDDSVFLENPEPRCPCVLLLDRSASMRGEPIRQLNAGLVTFRDELASDHLAAKRVEICCISFGPIAVDHDFAGAEAFSPPQLSASGDTPIGAAINQALDLIDERKHRYRSNGIAYYRPWVFLITDGGPTDSWKDAAARVRAAEQSNGLAFFAVGVHGARMDILAQLGSRQPVNLDGLRFRDMFVWLSQSLKAVSRSQPGTQVIIPPPSGWASV
jgi:uncharacterized protein YegL